MKGKKIFLIVAAVILLAAVLVAVLILNKGERQVVLFPTDVYEVYALNDSVAGGFSTSTILRERDSSVTATVNIRSGKAYSYAGIGINLLSVNHRPSKDFFDFSRFDSMEVEVHASRMKNVEIRILNNDPFYSQAGDLLSYRPKVKSLPAQGKVKIAFAEFKTPEWWLSQQGLEKDDFLSYFNRGVILAVVNGEGVLRGIPDEIQLKSIRLW